jgi:hypothetical protein
MKYTNILTLVFGLSIAPLFAMEMGYKPEVKPSQNRRTVPANVAFSISGIINEFNTPATVINLKEASAQLHTAMNPEYVYQIPAAMIKDCSVILPGTEEKHQLQNPFIINYPSNEDEYTSLVIIAADKVLKIRVNVFAYKTLKLVEFDKNGNSSKYAELAFNRGDSFVIKVARDGMVTLEKSKENKEEKKAEIKQEKKQPKKQIQLSTLEKQTLIESLLQGLKSIQKAPYQNQSEAVSAVIQTLIDSADLYKQTIGTDNYESTIKRLCEAIETKKIHQTVLILIAACDVQLQELKNEYVQELFKNL